MKTPKGIFLLIFILGFSISCKKDKNLQESIIKEEVKGIVQKGPFNNGTSVSIAELNSDLKPTGKIFNTQIINNLGSFEIKNLELATQFVELKASGFYFNEVLGENSIAQLTLFALTDLSDSSSINVNVISHLEKSRVEYLLSEGLTFKNAKSQAEQEIIKIFNINKTDIISSEFLNITKPQEDNAILLAISVILQSLRTESELSELLANISTDIEKDGTLNSSSIGTSLINGVKYLELNLIRQNLENRYMDLGEDVVIPDFEKYVRQFINNTDYVFTNYISYPKETDFGLNILNDSLVDVFTYNPLIQKIPAADYALSATLNKGNSLKVIISKENPCVIYSGWGCTYWWLWDQSPFRPVNWNFTEYRDIDGNCTIPGGHVQIFNAMYTAGGKCNLRLRFPPTEEHCNLKIEIYENNSLTPTKSKIITLKMTN